jgi:signal transduction histidine kinase
MFLEDLLAQNNDVAAPRPPGPADVPERDLETILNVVRKINTSLVLSDVLELVLDQAIRITAAERGFLMLANGEHRLEFVMGRTSGGESISAASFRVSSTALDDVFTTGESLCIESALHDARFERRESVLDLELQTILCSPLRTTDETLGVIYVDSKYIQPVERGDILNLFEILAGQAAIAIKNARLYENLQKAYHDLSEANDLNVKLERMATRGELIGEVSHELKNMVAIVSMSLELLNRKLGKLSEERIRELVGHALKSTNRIITFTEALQSRARAECKKISTDPNRLIKEFETFVQVLKRFKTAQLACVPADIVPQVAIDPDQIQQVLLNLVMNATQARPDATVILSTEYDPTERVVHLRVNDNGPGIERAVLERLFKEKITTKPDGHGYGLPVCRQIMTAHGGSISVNSTPGEGATFTLTFPVL